MAKNRGAGSVPAELEAAELRNYELENWKLEKEIALIKTTASARVLFKLLGPVEEHRVHNLIRDIDTWSHNHPAEPITLMIDSPGGAVTDGFALYDYLDGEIKSRGHHITTKAYGMAASMGGVMLQVGDRRTMSPRSRLLIHEVQAIVAGSFSQMEDDQKFNEGLQNDCLAILAARSNMTERQIKAKWKRKDWWLTPTEALKHGFIDAIEG